MTFPPPSPVSAATSPRVLLTGFEPFDGAASNESWDAVRRAAPLLRERGIDAIERELPVEFGRAGDLLIEAIVELRPALVVATGLAAGRSGITPERVAINIQDARIPDNAGASPIDQPSVPGGPVGCFSTLPIKAMVQAARDAGVPASVSQSAGTFVCNDVFYRLQHHLASGEADAGNDESAAPGVRGGFVHVPSADVVSAEEAARALVAMVETALAAADDLAVSGGAEH